MSIKQHDILVLGAGLGGLVVAAILAKQGKNVGVIEQHKQIGGCLQSYAHDKILFDSCVHYIGGLNEGNTLYKVFDYLEIMQHLEPVPYDEKGFDRIVFANDLTTAFPIAQGYEQFVAQLSVIFPQQKDALNAYVALVKDVVDKFPLYHLEKGDGAGKMEVMSWSLVTVLDDLFDDELLKKIIVGNAFLYAGNAATTPFYVHALVQNSYIQHASRLKGSSAQIAKFLWKTIQKYGGVIYKNEPIVAIDLPQNDVDDFSVNTSKGHTYKGAEVISNIHPEKTIALLPENTFKPAFSKRLHANKSTTSAFMINVVLKPNTVLYKNYNVYFNDGDPLSLIGEEAWLKQYALYFGRAESSDFASSISILCYMDPDVFQEHKCSFNTTNIPSERSDVYQKLKQKKAQELLNLVIAHYPELANNIQSWAAVTPLTFRDYMGTSDGSIYGYETDFHQPLLSQVPVVTKLPRFYFTGQNMNLHGVLGVTLTAVNTAGAIIGLDKILDDINNL